MKRKLIAQFIAAFVAMAATWLGAVAGTYDWQSDGSGYDGSFTSIAHWGGVAVPGETSGQADGSFKFVLPEGSPKCCAVAAAEFAKWTKELTGADIAGR